MNKLSYLLLGGILTCSILTACGSKTKPVVSQTEESESSLQSTEDAEAQTDSETESEDVGEGAGNQTGGRKIEEQSFDVNLKPLGRVTFASYEPDTSKNPLADAVFLIEKNGSAVQELEGVSEDNCRSNEIFNQVEAVSFLDYNNDECDDIIVICNYSPASGQDVGTGHSEIRYYSGSPNGTFSYQKQMSQDATSALSEITIQTAKGFIGAGNKVTVKPWQKAYLDYLQQGSDVANQEGYVLIYVDADEIPELVEVGKSEAGGCRIVNFSNGTIHVTQLNRLEFSYIERGNLLCNSGGLMDSYFDIVYSMIDGQLAVVSEGHYGAEDNSNLQFDAEGNPVYQYEWNGTQMSKEKYEEKLNSIYDSARTKGYNWGELYSVDEMTSILEKFYE